MKKIISFLIITFALLIISNVESKGSCASGFTQDTVTVTIGNCDYLITVCFKCAVTNPGEVYIKSIAEVDSSCNNALPIDQIIDQAYSEISNGSFIYSNLCIDSWYDAGPCDGSPTNYSQFIIHFSYCWQIKNRYNGSEYIDDYIPCEDNAECTETLTYCFNASTGKYDKVLPSTLSSAQTPPCELQFFEITLPGIGQTSECFIINSVPCGIE